jgi:hypothetical protein
MQLTSDLRSKLALSLVAGLAGLLAGAGLVAATINLASITTPQPSSKSAAGQGQAKGHGADVTSAVARCKAALAPGQHGIGKCVSAVANKHGKTVSGATSPKAQKAGTQDTEETDVSTNP